jgi:Cu(I)/Ag(I) efflux system membrane fusion protein
MIMVSSERRQTIGLATSTVEPRDFSRTIRTTAVVEHDETQLARVAPRFGGWIRKLHVNYTGQEVYQGDPLFSVYSPELLTTESEYLLALAHLQRLTNAPPDQQADARGLLQSSRRRLELMQIGNQEIAAVEARGRADDELLIRAPVSGHVISKTAVEGKAFMPGETLYEIGDLSHVWLRASVTEKDLSTVAVGLNAVVTLPYLPNREFESKVSFIYPHIDPQTRRAEVRLEMANTNHLVRPDMWANVEIRAELGNHLAVPASAVIDTGTRFIAFVDRPDQHLEPREVRIGARTEDHFQILEGLKEGEKVVTRALFLVDSESQLKAAIAAMEP